MKTNLTGAHPRLSSSRTYFNPRYISHATHVHGTKAHVYSSKSEDPAQRERAPEPAYIRTIDEISGLLAGNLTRGEIIQAALGSIVESLDATTGAVYTPGADRQRGWIRLEQHCPVQFQAGLLGTLPTGDPTVKALVTSREPLACCAQHMDTGSTEGPSLYSIFGFRNWAASAIFAGEKPCAILAVSRVSSAPFSKDQLRVLRAVGYMLAPLLVDAAGTERTGLNEADTEAGEQGDADVAELEAAAGSISEGLIICDGAGSISWANMAALQMLGTTKDMLVGSSMLSGVWNPPRDPEGSDKVEGPISDILSKKLSSAQYRIEVPALGEMRILSVSASAVIHRGRRQGLVAVLRDVTAEQEAEHRKEDFVGHLSHELRGPLTVISAAARMLGRSVSLKGNERDTRHALLIYEHAQRMAGLVEDLIESNRLESGLLTLNLVQSDMGELVRGVVERTRAEYKGSHVNHRLHVTVEPDLPLVQIDKGRIDQVLTNLLSNAIRYAPGGGPIKVAVEQMNGDESAVRVSVTDQGLGVPPEDRTRIFEQNYRGEGAKAISVTGLGLGLYICKLAIEAHGGEIGVTDGPEGKGSTFWFSIPCEA